MSEQALQEIRGVLFPLSEGQLLLPNLTMLEVIGFREAEGVKGAPEWLLGMVRWNQRRIPLVIFDYFISHQIPEPGYHARIAICYNPKADSRIPLIAILCHSVPRLARLNRETLKDVDDSAFTQMVLKKVRYQDADAWIPDLPGLADMMDIYLPE